MDTKYIVTGESPKDGKKWNFEVSKKFIDNSKLYLNLINDLDMSDNENIELPPINFEEEEFTNFYTLFQKFNVLMFEETGLGMIDYITSTLPVDSKENSGFFNTYIIEDDHEKTPHFTELYKIVEELGFIYTKDHLVNIADFLQNHGMLEMIFLILGHHVSEIPDEEKIIFFKNEIEHNKQKKEKVVEELPETDETVVEEHQMDVTE